MNCLSYSTPFMTDDTGARGSRKTPNGGRAREGLPKGTGSRHWNSQHELLYTAAREPCVSRHIVAGK